MRVLIVIGIEPEYFVKVGMGDSTFPKLPLAYPFYGFLIENGYQVEILSINFFTLFNLVTLKRVLGNFEVIISWGMIGALLACILFPFGKNKKVHTLVYSNKVLRLKGLFLKLKELIYCLGLKLCGGCIYMTREQENEAFSIIGLTREQVFFVPVGVDTNYFAPLPEFSNVPVSRELLSLGEKQYIVVSGDQLRNELEIAKVLSGEGLTLVRLTQEHKTQEFWDNWKKDSHAELNVFCKANLSFEEVRYVYQHSLCVLNLADNSWQPAGWTVLTEAMACAVPVIMNSGLVTKELRLYNDNLPIIELGPRPLDLEVKNAINKLRNNLQYARDLGLEGRRFVEANLMVENVAKAIIHVLDKAQFQN